MADFNVIVIGAGPGGYVAAIRCAQLGMTVACVDKWMNDKGNPVLGGTCLNVGCIPSKALLDSSHHYMYLKQHAAEHGITCDNLNIDITTMQNRKQEVVRSLTQGITGLFKKNHIKQLSGKAQLLGKQQVEITDYYGDKQIITADHLIIATGSVPTQIPAAIVDNQHVVDSTGALAFDQVPKRLGVIGAGAIGLELGSVWSRLGSQVTILEALPDFLPSADRRIAATALKELQKQGLTIHLATQVTAVTVIETNDTSQLPTVTVNYQNRTGNQSLVVDKLIVAVGRKPYTIGLNLEGVGVKLTERGFIQVDANRQTSVPGIYAIGDVIGGPMLAHKSSEEGIMIAERLAGQQTTMHYDIMPWVIYTHPEIAWVGRTEEQLQTAGITYKVGQFPFLASGRAKAQGNTTGLVRMLADAKTDQLLGVHIFGMAASELLAEAVVAMEFQASSEDLARTIHAHPTLAEAIHEAALATEGRTIHL